MKYGMSFPLSTFNYLSTGSRLLLNNLNNHNIAIHMCINFWEITHFSVTDNDDVPEEVCTDIEIVTEAYGNENSWTFGNCNSTQEYNSYDTYIEQCCQPMGTYQLVCADSYGDGWHGGYIEIGGSKYCEDFMAGSAESHDVAMPGKPRF